AYAFTLMLVTFLLGLVAGGAIYARFLGARASKSHLAFTQSLLALVGVISMALLGQIRPLGHHVESVLAALGPSSGRYLSMLLQSMAVMLIPTTLIGVALPLLTGLAADRLDEAGARVGRLYAANTLGGIAGSLAISLVAIPLL